MRGFSGPVVHLLRLSEDSEVYFRLKVADADRGPSEARKEGRSETIGIWSFPVSSGPSQTDGGSSEQMVQWMTERVLILPPNILVELPLPLP